MGIIVGLVFGLLGLVIAGIAPLALPTEVLGLATPVTSRLYQLWLGSLHAFAVPAALLLLVFFKSAFLRFCSLLWALWVGALSLAILFRAQGLLPGITFYGTLLVVCTALSAACVALFSVFSLATKHRIRSS